MCAEEHHTEQPANKIKYNKQINMWNDAKVVGRNWQRNKNTLQLNELNGNNK